MGTSGKGFGNQTEVMKILLLILGLGTLACYGSPMYDYRSGDPRPLKMPYFKPAPAQVRRKVRQVGGYGYLGYRGLTGAGYQEPVVQVVQETPITGVYAGQVNGYRGIMSNLGDIGAQGAQILTDVIKQILANVLNQAQGEVQVHDPQTVTLRNCQKVEDTITDQ